MSLTKCLDVPEVEMETSKLIYQMLHLCQGYRQVQMRCFSEKLNLPVFGRLFELIRELEMRYMDEIVRFQISRGQKVTWFDVKPTPDLEEGNPLDIIQFILEFEKHIHKLTIRLSKLSFEKGDYPLTAFLHDRVIPRQVKVIHKRANQLRDLDRSNDDETPFLTDRLNMRFEVEKLEKRLRMEMVRSEDSNTCSHEQRIMGEKEISLIESTNRF